jgi:virginiamycin B lyase
MAYRTSGSGGVLGRVAASIVSVLAVSSFIVPWFASPANASTPVVTNYPATGTNSPVGIAAGSDGALWFANVFGSSIGRMTTGGTFTNNYTGAAISNPFGIVAGPDGALWFANANGTIGRITTGGVSTSYTTGLKSAGLTEIAVGSDGALWFANGGSPGSIGRMTTGGAFTNYTGTGISSPFGITAGPDGALWFTNQGNDTIGRITTGGVVTSYTGPISYPYDITAGPDGALWFTNGGSGSNSIGRITTGGVVTNYTGTGISGPAGITTGPDGALWFTNAGANSPGTSIGRITTGGVVTNYTGTGIRSPNRITTGPDGALWFTNTGNNTIGRITTGSNPPPTTSVLTPSSGATLSGSTTLDASASNATSVQFLLLGGKYGFTGQALCTATLTLYGWVCSWNTTTVPNGSYSLVSEAFNSAGSAFSSGVSITVKNPPTTNVVIPSKGATLSGSTYLDASAPNATSAEFWLLGGSYGYSGHLVGTATSTYYGWLDNWNTTTVPNGSYTLVSEVFNSDGSAFSPGVSITVSN